MKKLRKIDLLTRYAKSILIDFHKIRLHLSTIGPFNHIYESQIFQKIIMCWLFELKKGEICLYQIYNYLRKK